MSAVIPGSPAASSGIMVGDEIEQVNGTTPGTVVCPAPAWDSTGTKKANLRLLRHGRAFIIKLDLVPVRALLDLGWINTTVKLLSASSADQSSLPRLRFYGLGIALLLDSQGAVVDAVMSGSPAEDSQIHPGDRILAVNGRPVDKSFSVIASALAGQTLEIKIERNGSSEMKLLRVLGPSRTLRLLVKRFSDEEEYARFSAR